MLFCVCVCTMYISKYSFNSYTDSSFNRYHRHWFLLCIAFHTYAQQYYSLSLLPSHSQFYLFDRIVRNSIPNIQQQHFMEISANQKIWIQIWNMQNKHFNNKIEDSNIVRVGPELFEAYEFIQIHTLWYGNYRHLVVIHGWNLRTFQHTLQTHGCCRRRRRRRQRTHCDRKICACWT